MANFRANQALAFGDVLMLAHTGDDIEPALS